MAGNIVHNEKNPTAMLGTKEKPWHELHVRTIKAENVEANNVFGGVPVGTIIAHAGEKVPPGCLVCDGREVGRLTYPELFAEIGTIYGEGDGKDTFNLPDLQGVFLRGLGGNSAELGEQQGDAIRNITGTASAGGGTALTTSHANAELNTGAFFGVEHEALTHVTARELDTSGIARQLEFDPSRVVPTADENRPVNMAMLFCIKAFGSATHEGQINMAELANEVKDKAYKSEVIGIGQTWQNVTSDRQYGVYYTNTTGKAIMVCLTGANTSSSAAGSHGEVDGVTVQAGLAITGLSRSNLSFIVPSGSTYRIFISGSTSTASIELWAELR